MLWILSGKESACQCRGREFDPWVRKIPPEKEWQPAPVFLPGNSMDRGAWQATVHKQLNNNNTDTKMKILQNTVTVSPL